MIRLVAFGDPVLSTCAFFVFAGRSEVAVTDDPLVADSRADILVDTLRRRGETVATAESLTAGLLGATIAGVPGASAVLRGGLIVYATDLKHVLAGVDNDVLTAYGPVSEPVASALAAGAARRCSAKWGLALTGVAGPDEQDGHPPGEVYCGIACLRVRYFTGSDDRIDVVVHRLELDGERWDVRTRSVAECIELFLHRIELLG